MCRAVVLSSVHENGDARQCSRIIPQLPDAVHRDKPTARLDAGATFNKGSRPLVRIIHECRREAAETEVLSITRPLQGSKKNQRRAPGIVEDFFDLRMMQMAARRLLQQNGMYSDRFLMPSRCARSMADNLMP